MRDPAEVKRCLETALPLLRQVCEALEPIEEAAADDSLSLPLGVWRADLEHGLRKGRNFLEHLRPRVREQERATAGRV